MTGAPGMDWFWANLAEITTRLGNVVTYKQRTQSMIHAYCR